MKKWIIGFLVICISTNLSAQGIVINGELKNLPDAVLCVNDVLLLSKNTSKFSS